MRTTITPKRSSLVSFVLTLLLLFPAQALAGGTSFGSTMPPSEITMKPTDAKTVPVYFVNTGQDPIDVRISLEHKSTSTITVRANGVALPYDFTLLPGRDPSWIGDKNLVLGDGKTIAKMKMVQLNFITSNTPVGDYKVKVVATTLPSADLSGTGQAVVQAREYQFAIHVRNPGEEQSSTQTSTTTTTSGGSGIIENTIQALTDIVEGIISSITPQDTNGADNTLENSGTSSTRGGQPEQPTQPPSGDTGNVTREGDTRDLGPTGRILSWKTSEKGTETQKSSTGILLAGGALLAGIGVGVLYSRRKRGRRRRLW